MQYRESLFQLQTEDEKHSNFLDNRVVEGVEMTHYFQKNIVGKSEPVVEVIILAIYPLCLLFTASLHCVLLVSIN